MKKAVKKIKRPDQAITKKFVAKEFSSFEKKIDRRFKLIDERFEKVGKRFDGIEKGIGYIIKELGAIRQENREFLQMREQLYSNDLRQERQIVDLQERMHVLEIAK